MRWDHMLYPPTSATVLLKRADERKMCLHEALCWKQLPDWRTVDPPAWTCPHARSRRIYDMSFHNVVMADQSTFVEKSLNKFSGTDHKVFLCNCKNGKSAISNYHYPFNICPGVQGTECTKTKPSHALAQKTFNSYCGDIHFQGADALVFGFGSAI